MTDEYEYEHSTIDTSETPQVTAPRTLEAIRADWQQRIDDARALEAQFGEPGSAIWSTVYSIDREELARVLQAVACLDRIRALIAALRENPA